MAETALDDAARDAAVIRDEAVLRDEAARPSANPPLGEI
jgi:hypothetical protein